jgi:hypothetical protein
MKFSKLRKEVTCNIHTTSCGMLNSTTIIRIQLILVTSLRQRSMSTSFRTIKVILALCLILIIKSFKDHIQKNIVYYLVCVLVYLYKLLIFIILVLTFSRNSSNLKIIYHICSLLRKRLWLRIRFSSYKLLWWWFQRQSIRLCNLMKTVIKILEFIKQSWLTL